MNVRVPKARNTDPETSHLAAGSVEHLNARRAAVLYVLDKSSDGLTDTELIDSYADWRDSAPELFPQQSESGLRTRRSELVRAGKVRHTGRHNVLPSGRLSIVWAVIR